MSTPKLSETTKQYRAGLTAFFDGDKATAVKNLKAVVEDQPANGFASEYLKKAKDLPNPPPPDEGISTTLLLIVGGGLLLLALLGGLAFMLLRRRSGPGSVAAGSGLRTDPGWRGRAPPVPGRADGRCAHGRRIPRSP